MLLIDVDDCGVPIYMVCNNQGLCLIRTTDNQIAYFVESLTKGLDPYMRLNVGGDPGTRKQNPKIFHHVRRFRH